MFSLFKFRSIMDFNNNRGQFLFKLKLKRILKKDTIIVCIGTPRVSGDSVGPIIGSKLISKNCKYPVYGTISDPITALNINQKIEEIIKKHPQNTILAIDASATTIKQKLNKVILEKKPIKPGAGLNKKLPSIGDFSVKVVNILYDDNSDNLLDKLCEFNDEDAINIADKIVNMIL